MLERLVRMGLRPRLASRRRKIIVLSNDRRIQLKHSSKASWEIESFDREPSDFLLLVRTGTKETWIIPASRVKDFAQRREGDYRMWIKSARLKRADASGFFNAWNQLR
jgi:hypothetical protein